MSLLRFLSCLLFLNLAVGAQAQESKVNWSFFMNYGLDATNNPYYEPYFIDLYELHENFSRPEFSLGAKYHVSESFHLMIGLGQSGTRYSKGGYAAIFDDMSFRSIVYRHNFKLKTRSIFIGISQNLSIFNIAIEYHLTRSNFKDGMVSEGDNSLFQSEVNLYAASYKPLFYSRLGISFGLDFIKTENGSFGIYFKALDVLNEHTFAVREMDPDLDAHLSSNLQQGDYNRFFKENDYYDLDIFLSYGLRFNYLLNRKNKLN